MRSSENVFLRIIYRQVEVTVTLQCSGTRRIEQIQQYPGEGDELINAPWGTPLLSKREQITYSVTPSFRRRRHVSRRRSYLLSIVKLTYLPSGTAVYRGVPLKKVLKKACGGVLPECQHLEFIGADTYFKCVYCLMCRQAPFQSTSPSYQEEQRLQLRRFSPLEKSAPE